MDEISQVQFLSFEDLKLKKKPSAPSSQHTMVEQAGDNCYRYSYSKREEVTWVLSLKVTLHHNLTSLKLFGCYCE